MVGHPSSEEGEDLEVAEELGLEDCSSVCFLWEISLTRFPYKTGIPYGGQGAEVRGCLHITPSPR
jgi:hypothetical protein